jgi:hypothetical protein
MAPLARVVAADRLVAWSARSPGLWRGAGAVYLAAVVLAAAGRVLPVQAVVLLAMAGLPLYMLWALADYRSLILAAFASGAVVQIEPAPFDILAPVLAAGGLLTGRVVVRTGRQSWVLAAFLGLTLASIAQAADLRVGLRYAAITTYLVGLYLVVAGMRLHEDRQAVLAGVTTAALGAVALALLGFYRVLGLEHLVYADEVRWQGAFKDPNIFGAYLVIPLAWALERVIAGYRTRWMVAAIVVLLVSLVMSHSRGATLALAVALAIMAAEAVRRRQWAGLRRAAAALMLGLALAAGFVTAHGLWDVTQGRAGIQVYDHDRVLVWRTSVTELSLPGWLLGIGPGQFEGRRFGGILEYAAHSLYLRVLVESGAVTLVAFLIFIGLHLRGIPDLQTGALWGVAAGTITAVTVGQLAYGLFIDALHWRHLWVLLGVATWFRRR